MMSIAKKQRDYTLEEPAWAKGHNKNKNKDKKSNIDF